MFLSPFGGGPGDAENEDVAYTGIPSMKSRTEPITEADKDALFPVIHDLLNIWCDRRAFAPLRILLRAYPLSSGLSEDWHQLHETLRDLEILRDSTTVNERERITYARRIVQFILDRR